MKVIEAWTRRGPGLSDYCDVSGCSEQSEWKREIVEWPDEAAPGTLTPAPKPVINRLSVEHACSDHKDRIDAIESSRLQRPQMTLSSEGTLHLVEDDGG